MPCVYFDFDLGRKHGLNLEILNGDKSCVFLESVRHIRDRKCGVDFMYRRDCSGFVYRNHCSKTYSFDSKLTSTSTSTGSIALLVLLLHNNFLHNKMKRCNVLRFTIGSLVVILIILQLIHLSMISWLENRTSKRRTSAIFPRKEGGGGGGVILVQGGGVGGGRGDYPMVDTKPLARSPPRFRIPDAKLDTSGSYKIYPYFMKSSSMESMHYLDVNKEYKDVTLVTQCSLHHLGHIVELVERWKGPVSLSIFGLASEIDTISTVMFSLQECYPAIKQNVTFHLVHPITEWVDGEGNINTRQSTLTKLPCDTIIPDLWEKKLLTQNYAQEGIPFPNNLLRNVARTGTSSKYVLVVDIDMLPSAHMRTGFLHLAHSSILLQEETEYSRKTTFVVPAYEVRNGITLPGDKAELMEVLRQDDARQFYVKACSYCQNHTDYRKWESIQVGKTHNKKMLKM